MSERVKSLAEIYSSLVCSCTPEQMQEEHKEYVSIIEKENIKKITEMGVK
jgi:hypothetical protein